MTRWIGLVALGLGGLAILIALGTWQVRRLAWKTAILSEIETRIAAAPVDLPADPDPVADRYLPVRVQGRLGAEELHVFVSTEALGPAYRLIRPLETGGRRVMVDLGAVPDDAKDDRRPAGPVTVDGNLLWPDEVDGFTPDPERDTNIWYARDAEAMAAALGTAPILVVARRVDPPIPGVTAFPVTTEGIPNDHLQYAITWFSLAAIWAGMTAFLGWRMAKRTV